MTTDNYRSRRVFATERLKSFAGYLAAPSIYDAMHFFLPSFRLKSSRVVKINDRRWELWSPNSERSMFYPGRRSKELDLEDPADKGLMRCDGHLGRFDPTVSPQHFDPEQPWLGFVRREGNDAHPEYTSLIDVWQPVSLPNRGYLKPTYIASLELRLASVVERVEGWKVLNELRPELWTRRPSFPTPAFLGDLRNATSFDDAVTRLARAQRGIKYMSAWCRMACSIVTDSKAPPVTLSSVPPAEEYLMGIWLNNCEEKDGLWLLKWKVPCYIVHTIELSSEIERIRRINPHYPNFVDSTPAAKLTPTTYAFDLAVLSEGGKLNDVDTDYAILPAWNSTPLMRADRLRASPTRQGFLDGEYKDPRYHPPADFVPQNIREEEGKIIPPPVAGVPPGRSWSTWVEDMTDDNEPCMIKVGRRNSGSDDGKVYYDRENLRRLYFTDHPFVPPNYEADISVFGLPAPAMPYLETVNNQSKANRRPSQWVYKLENPVRGTIGQNFVPRRAEGPSQPLLTSNAPKITDTDSDEEIDFRSRSSASPALEPRAIDVPRIIAPNMSDLPPLDPYKNRERQASTPPVENRPSRGRSTSRSWNAPRPRRSPSPALSIPRGRSRNETAYFNHLPERAYRRSSRSLSPRSAPRTRTHLRRTDRHWSPSPQRSSRVASPHSHPPRHPAPVRHRPPPNRSSPPPSRSRRHEQSPRPRTPREASTPYLPRSPARQPHPPSPARSPWESTDHISIAEPFSHNVAAVGSEAAADDETNMDEDIAIEDAMDISEETGLMTVAQNPIRDREMLDALIPAPFAPSFPILTSLAARAQTKFLCIWSVAVFFTWDDVTRWISNILASTKVQITRVVRTNEDGSQVFWLKMGSTRDAAIFRGLVAGANTSDLENIGCDFIHGDLYSKASGKSRDIWSPAKGFQSNVDSSAPFSANSRSALVDRISSVLTAGPSAGPSATSSTNPSLLDRLSSTGGGTAAPKKNTRRGTRGKRTTD
jgi:hypothetical protein